MTTAVDQLTAALAAEHAAIFGYGLLGARLDAAADAAHQAETAHRDRRDTLIARLAENGATPPAAEPVYSVPGVTNAADALRLAVLVEERTAQAWRAALPVTKGADRTLALDALIDAASRAERWRRASGAKESTVAFPGMP